MSKIRPQYYLKRWRMLEENRNNLTSHEIRLAKILFNSLAKLSEESIKVLKEKYYDAPNLCSFDAARQIYMSVVPLSDDGMAHEKEMELEEYVTMRREAERKLLIEMQIVEKLVRKSESRLLVKIGHFYVKSFNTQKSLESVELIRWKKEARVFEMDKADDKKLVDKFLENGFDCETEFLYVEEIEHDLQRQNKC